MMMMMTVMMMRRRSTTFFALAAAATLDTVKIPTKLSAAASLPAKIAEAKEKSMQPGPAHTKGKNTIEIDDAKKAIEEDASMGKGVFDKEFGRQKYRVHQPTRKEMGTKLMAEALGFDEQLGYPSGSTIIRGGPDDYFYCCPDSRETEVCRYMADNIGFPKLKAMLSMLPFDEFSYCLAYTHLKVKFTMLFCCFEAGKCYMT